MGWGHFQLIPRVSIKFEKHEHKLIFKIRWFPPKESKTRHLQPETMVFPKRLIRGSTQDNHVKLRFFHVSSVDFILCQFDCKFMTSSSKYQFFFWLFWKFLFLFVNFILRMILRWVWKIWLLVMIFFSSCKYFILSNELTWIIWFLYLFYEYVYKYTNVGVGAWIYLQISIILKWHISTYQYWNIPF